MSEAAFIRSIRREISRPPRRVFGEVRLRDILKAAFTILQSESGPIPNVGERCANFRRGSENWLHRVRFQSSARLHHQYVTLDLGFEIGITTE